MRSVREARHASVHGPRRPWPRPWLRECQCGYDQYPCPVQQAEEAMYRAAHRPAHPRTLPDWATRPPTLPDRPAHPRALPAWAGPTRWVPILRNARKVPTGEEFELSPGQSLRAPKRDGAW